MPSPRKSRMRLRTYRVTSTGRRIELSRSSISASEPYQRPLTDVWPDCRCRRCDPLRRRATGESLPSGR